VVTVLRAFVLLAVAGCVSCLPVDADLGPQPEVSVSESGPAPDEYVKCDADAPAATCPDLADGTPSRCIPARQLGGVDFCAPAVASCNPSSAVCAPGLACYRTDLLTQEGVCTTIPVCVKSEDCPASRPACGGDLLRALFPPGTPFFGDHLPCFQSPCDARKCDGRCLREQVTDPSYVPDVCVPFCDETGSCPANFFCEQRVGSAYPPICVPGLPGYRCFSDDDCLLGSCLELTPNLSVCSGTCESDDDCAWLRGARRPVVCARDTAASSGVCTTISPFEGEACSTARVDGHSEDCPAMKNCYWFSPVRGDISGTRKPEQATGECRTPCPADKRCPAVAGLPHVCLGEGAGGCYPAELGVPCESLGEGAACIGGLLCEQVGALEPPDLPSSALEICTLPCQPDAAAGDPFGDEDCRKNSLTAAGFCHEDGFCRRPRSEQDPCTRGAQCGVLRCDPNAGRCVMRGAGDACERDADCFPLVCGPDGTCRELSPR
jgi:hypothetical protein